MKKYKIEVWYRFVSCGEQEKDFDIVEVEAKDESEAKRKALENYKGLSLIPFKTEIK